jgi:acyl carrier protein
MERLIKTLGPGDLFRVVRDIFIDELARSRGTGFDRDAARDWNRDTTVRENGLALDSLERFTLAGRLNETFSLFESGVEDNLLRTQTLGDTVDVIRAGLDHAAPAIAFYSGGTTGTPRPRRHATELLEQEIAVLTEIFADRRRVIVTAPVHHIYPAPWACRRSTPRGRSCPDRAHPARVIWWYLFPFCGNACSRRFPGGGETCGEQAPQRLCQRTSPTEVARRGLPG